MSLTYNQAVEQTITAGEQIHQIVNGTATTEVTVEDGSKVPSIRKALLDNFYFKDPIAWQVGQTENVFNQLRQFTDGSWWYAPTATASNPISMGSTPVGDPMWKAYSFDAIGKLTPQIRESLRRSYAEAGYNLVNGSFEAGGELVNANDVLLQESTGKAFSGPAGTVAAGTNPASGGFVDKSGVLLRHELSNVEERLLGVGAKIYRGSNGQYVQNGDTVPAGTTHLAVLISGKVETVAMSPIASGTVSDLTESSANIGGTPVVFSSASVREFNNVQDMLSVVNSIPTGTKCSTGRTKWIRNNTVNSDITDFSLIGKAWYGDFGIVCGYASGNLSAFKILSLVNGDIEFGPTIAPIGIARSDQDTDILLPKGSWFGSRTQIQFSGYAIPLAVWIENDGVKVDGIEFLYDEATSPLTAPGKTWNDFAAATGFNPDYSYNFEIVYGSLLIFAGGKKPSVTNCQFTGIQAAYKNAKLYLPKSTTENLNEDVVVDGVTYDNFLFGINSSNFKNFKFRNITAKRYFNIPTSAPGHVLYISIDNANHGVMSDGVEIENVYDFGENTVDMANSPEHTLKLNYCRNVVGRNIVSHRPHGVLDILAFENHHWSGVYNYRDKSSNTNYSIYGLRVSNVRPSFSYYEPGFLSKDLVIDNLYIGPSPQTTENRGVSFEKDQRFLAETATGVKVQGTVYKGRGNMFLHYAESEYDIDLHVASEDITNVVCNVESLSSTTNIKINSDRTDQNRITTLDGSPTPTVELKSGNSYIAHATNTNALPKIQLDGFSKSLRNPGRSISLEKPADGVFLVTSTFRNDALNNISTVSWLANTINGVKSELSRVEGTQFKNMNLTFANGLFTASCDAGTDTPTMTLTLSQVSVIS